MVKVASNIIIYIYSICLRLCLKLFKDDEFRNALGNEFHSLGAEYENDLSNTDDCDLGIANVPLADDLSARLCVSDTGFNSFEIYSGVKLCKAYMLRPPYYI